MTWPSKSKESAAKRGTRRGQREGGMGLPGKEPQNAQTPPVRMIYPMWDYWDAYDLQSYAREHLPKIVFDLDGTLLDSRELAIEGHRAALSRMGLSDVSDEVLSSLNGPTSEQAMKILDIPVSRAPEFEAHMREIAKDMMFQKTRLFPGVADMLAKLEGKAALCLLSNGSPHYVAETANMTNIARYFDHIQGFVPGMTKARRLTIWKERYEPSRMMMIGDRASDIESAHDAGLLAVGVTYGAGSVEELTDADLLATSVEELRRICLAFCEI